MADNFRVKINDVEGNGTYHGSSEEKDGKSVLPSKDTSDSQSFEGSKLQSNSSGNTSIELESNADKLNFDVSGLSKLTDIHTDIYSEDPSYNYGLSESEAEYAEMVARLGDPYGKIFNIDADDADLSAAVDELGLYNKTLDPAKMNALAKNLIYGTLQEVLSDLTNKEKDTSPGSNDGGSGSGDGDGYSNINEDGSNTSNPSLRPFSINIPLSDLGEGTDPYSDVLTTVDDLVNQITTSEEVDYSDTKTEDVADFADNSNNSGYGDIDTVEIDEDKTSKWALRAMPDAMSNMFDVYFRICDNDTNVDGDHLSPNIPGVNNLFGSRLLSARIQSIEIPAYERQTTEMRAWGGRIDRPTDVISTPGQSSFTIRGDTRLLYIDFMNLLSGTPMADYLGTGGALYDVSTSLGVSKTGKYMREISAEVKSSVEECKKAVEEANKDLAEVQERAKRIETDYYIKMLKETGDDEKFMKAVNAKVRPEGISVTDAKWELMCNDNNSEKEKLKAQLKEIKEKEADEFASSYWAAEEERRKQMKKVKELIAQCDRKAKNYDATLKIYTDATAKKIRNAKGKRNREVISAIFRNRPVDVEKENSEAAAYVTGAIARNMSICCSVANLNKSFNDLSNHKRVDIIVKRTPQGNTFRSMASPKKDERFIFEDVKLLGTSNAISFKRESAETQDFTYNFIYKRFYKLDYYADDASAWITSQLDDLANWSVKWIDNKMKKAIDDGVENTKKIFS